MEESFGRDEKAEEYLRRYLQSKYKQKYTPKFLQYSKDSSNIQKFTFVNDKTDTVIEYFSNIEKNEQSFALIILKFLYLTAVPAKRKIIIFTERDTYSWFIRKINSLSISQKLEILHVDIET